MHSYHTAKALELWTYNPGAARLVAVSPRSTPRSTPRAGPRTTPIKKDDYWITKSPAKTPTRVTKRVTFADTVESTEDAVVKPSKIGKLFPELKAKFEAY